jgi:hypothetical protein
VSAPTGTFALTVRASASVWRCTSARNAAVSGSSSTGSFGVFVPGGSLSGTDLGSISGLTGSLIGFKPIRSEISLSMSSVFSSASRAARSFFAKPRADGMMLTYAVPTSTAPLTSSSATPLTPWSVCGPSA